MDGAIESLRARARAGDARALASLGWRLIISEGVKPSPREGVGYLKDAARQGDGEATALLARLAAWGALERRDIGKALDLLQRAAELDWAPAQAELRFLAQESGSDWPALRARIDPDALMAPPRRRVLSESPRLRVFDSFATSAECDWLIAQVSAQLRRSEVYQGAPSAQVSNVRTNTEADFMIKSAGVAVSIIRDRIAAAVGVRPDFCEVTKLLHYEPGETFQRHSDFFEPKTFAMQQEIASRGQRVATFLLYLNDNYEGGETEFCDVGIRYKGRKGDALLFINVDAIGEPDYKTVHAGSPPTRGEKWVLSQWVRSRSVNPFMTPGLSDEPLSAEWLRSA